MKSLLSLSRYSIRKQILIGYVPVLFVLGFLAMASHTIFKSFSKDFHNLQEVTQENILFLEVDKDIVELQRNILVYSYIGYEGVLRKVDHLQVQLEDKFAELHPKTKKDPEVEDRFKRLVTHYESYKSNFQDAAKEKKSMKLLRETKLGPLQEQCIHILKEIKNALVKEKDFSTAFITADLEQNLYKVNLNIKTFELSPDASLIKENNQLFDSLTKNTTLLRSKIEHNDILVKQVDSLQQKLTDYRNTFSQIIKFNRVYLYLVNVVLAGKAAEIDKLSEELDLMAKTRANKLNEEINKSLHLSQKQFVTLSLFAGLMGVLSALIVAMGIATPVREMATTLSKLANGKSDTVIPGQSRQDEVGEMAIAANEFKNMADRLEQQTNELEEFAYRTSHDLRSPLVSSIGLLKLTEASIKKGDNEKAAKSIQFVQKSLIKLESLVKDILELTKTKNISENKQRIDVEEIVDETLETLSNMPNFECIKIEKSIDEIPSFYCEKTRLVLIIENLISNAIKYRDPEKPESFIRVSASLVNSDLVISIEDNGLGIPKGQQDQLFSMFKRFHPRVSYGSGLGLYMMKKSIDILKGQINYNDTGNGSLFKVVIPER